MEQDKKTLFSEWAKSGENDELNIVSIMKHRDGTPSMVCFLSQQMGEKYLKGLLLVYSDDYPKIHSLNKIMALLKPYNFDTEMSLKKEIAILDAFYVETRYVSDVPLENYTWKMAEEAYEAAKKIKELVLKKIDF
jgi:HEPN domain-containing protein